MSSISTEAMVDLMTDVVQMIRAAKWRAFGIQLGLSPATLSSIQSQTAGRPNDAIRMVLEEWHLNGPNTHTPKTIIDALKTPSVGELALANDLEVKYADRSQAPAEYGGDQLPGAYPPVSNYQLPGTYPGEYLPSVGINVKASAGYGTYPLPGAGNYQPPGTNPITNPQSGTYPPSGPYHLRRAGMVQPSNEQSTSGASNGNGQQPQIHQDQDEKPAHGDEMHIRLLDRERRDVAEKAYNNPFVQQYCKEVKIILQAANSNELLANFSKLQPPQLNDGTKSPKIIRFTQNFPGLNLSGAYTLGIFGGYKVACVLTEQGQQSRPLIDATIGLFTNVSFIIGVGVAYGSSRDKYKLGDVLISDKIACLDNIKFQRDSVIQNRSTIEAIKRKLHTLFCESSYRFANKFVCTEGAKPRFSKAHVGCIISGSFLVDNREMKSRLLENAREAIGGEMEGYVLMGMIRNRDPCPFQAIIIKGVCDYADGTKEKQWQLTAALAAVEYTHFQLELTDRNLFSEDEADGIEATADGPTPGQRPNYAQSAGNYSNYQPPITYPPSGPYRPSPSGTNPPNGTYPAMHSTGAYPLPNTSPQGVPTIKLLTSLPYLVGGVRKNLNIIQRTSTSYTKLGMYLLDDENCDIVHALKEKHHHDPVEIVTNIYKKWISGTGRKPITWQTLVGVLRDIELNTLADDIEYAIQPN